MTIKQCDRCGHQYKAPEPWQQCISSVYHVYIGHIACPVEIDLCEKCLD